MVRILKGEEAVVETATQEEVIEEAAKVEEKDLSRVSDEVKAIIRQGKEVINEVELESLASKSKDIEFVAVIINNYRRGNKKRGDEYVPEGVPCGLRLRNAGSEPIEYYKSKVTNKKHPSLAEELAIGLPVEKQVAQPGEEFDVAFYDFAELAGRPEYGGYIHAPSLALDSEIANDVFVKLSTSTKIAKDAALPTVKYTAVVLGDAPERKDNKFVKGAVKKTMAVKDKSIYIGPEEDTIFANVGSPIKPEFQEQFGVLAEVVEPQGRTASTGTRPAGTKSRRVGGKNVPAEALGLSALLKRNLAQ